MGDVYTTAVDLSTSHTEVVGILLDHRCFSQNTSKHKRQRFRHLLYVVQMHNNYCPPQQSDVTILEIPNIKRAVRLLLVCEYVYVFLLLGVLCRICCVSNAHAHG